MLLSVSHDFLFVATTKTASTSITEALLPFAEIERGGTPERKHIRYADILREYDFLFSMPGYGIDRFFTFAVMRDPVNWLHSWYRYRKGNKTAAPLPRDMSFGAFWRAKDWTVVAADGRRKLQRDWLVGPDGEIGVDLVLPYGQIANSFARIAGALGIDAGLGHANASWIKAEAEAVPEALRAEIEDWFAEDYALWRRLEEVNAPGWARLDAKARARAA